MQLDIVVVMDPIDRIKTAKDTTFAMLLEGQRRGHRLHYVRPGGLFLRDGRAAAIAAPLQVRDDPADWFGLGAFGELALGPGQAVLMRTDPPVDADYLHDTQLLDFARRQGALIVNDPRGLRDFNEKLAALEFPECCPPTLVSRDAAALKAFVQQHGHDLPRRAVAEELPKRLLMPGDPVLLHQQEEILRRVAGQRRAGGRQAGP